MGFLVNITSALERMARFVEDYSRASGIWCSRFLELEAREHLKEITKVVKKKPHLHLIEKKKKLCMLSHTIRVKVVFQSKTSLNK